MRTDELGQFNTSVYIKPTDKGLYTNYNSYISDTYKKSIAQTLVFRAIKYSSRLISFNSETNGIKQVPVKNSFPLLIVDSNIQRSLHKYVTLNDDLPKDPITFYVKLCDLRTMKPEENTLSNILHQHVMPTVTDQKIKLISYFRPQKQGSCFSTRPPKIDPDYVSVVSQFPRTEVACQATYIGVTTCTLRKRSSQHKYSISAIHQFIIFMISGLAFILASRQL